MENTSTSMINMFPTQVWMGRPSDETLIEIQSEIESTILKVEGENDTSVVSYVSYNAPETRQPHTDLNNLILHYPMQSFVSFVQAAMLDYVSNSQWRLPIEYWKRTGNEPKVDIVIHESWLNLGKKGSQQQVHVHPGAMLSGVYFHKVSENSAPLIFRNPNPLMENMEFPEGLMNQCVNFVTPTEGGLVLFPSWLAHSTGKQISDEDRYTIAFNANVFLQVEDETSPTIWSPS